jgi:hypothetical protein
MDVAANGTGRIVVAGQDVSQQVRGFTFNAQVGEPPMLTLYEMAEGGIEAEGIVRVVEDGLDQRQAVVEFLSNLDPEELNRVAMEKMSWDPAASPGQGFISALKEMVGGD